MLTLVPGNPHRNDVDGLISGPVRHNLGCKAYPRGFSLVELIIAIALGMVLLGVMYSLFTTQNKVLGDQNQLVNMQQNARTAMDMMVSDIRMAGSNPTRTLTKCTGSLPASLTNAACVGILNADSSVIQINMDKSNSAGTGSPDGATDGPNETITYGLYSCIVDGASVPCLGRQTRSTDSTYRLVADNVQSLSFSYQDETGSSAANIDSIRKITISLVARTAKQDPSYSENSGYRTLALTSQVTATNLGY